MQLSPGINLPEVLSQVDKNPSSPSKKIFRGSGSSSPNPPLQSADAAKDELQSSDDEYKDHRNLTEYENPKFLGKSSGFKFIQFAMDSRNFITGKDLECTKANLMRRDEYWGIKDVRKVFMLKESYANCCVVDAISVRPPSSRLQLS